LRIWRVYLTGSWGGAEDLVEWLGALRGKMAEWGRRFRPGKGARARGAARLWGGGEFLLAEGGRDGMVRAFSRPGVYLSGRHFHQKGLIKA